MKEDRIFGSYLFKNYANKGKLEKINQVLTEYRKTAKDIAIYLWDMRLVNNFVSHNKISC